MKKVMIKTNCHVELLQLDMTREAISDANTQAIIRHHAHN
jgi:hypothetical protein